MMRQFAIIGLGKFGLYMLERLSQATDEIILVDKDSVMVEKHKDMVKGAFIADASDGEVLERIIPQGLDAAIVDVGGGIEASILVVSNLKKIGVQSIIVKADDEQRGEILKMVGATRIVYPDREAALQIVPSLVSPSLFSFIQISDTLVMAELLSPKEFLGHSLIEANLRKKARVNVIAIRKKEGSEYMYFTPDYRLQPDDLLLVAGKPEDVEKFTGMQGTQKKKNFGELFQGIFGRHTAASALPEQRIRTKRKGQE
jgi:trk system potassium uptake protein